MKIKNYVINVYLEKNVQKVNPDIEQLQEINEKN